jgi:2-dehydro-3-deoxyglucarate aldolase/4-hydroxy-2-oxoheptanedioate aldolase
LQKNTVKERLKTGGLVYGTSLGGCLEPEISIVLAAAGVEFFFIDTEHSVTTYPQIQGLCRTARGAGVIPLVRITRNEPSLISRALDVGAMGIIVPQVHSASEASAAMDALKFPPLGHRGFGLGTIVTDLKGNSAQEEVNSANRETMAVMMIESQEGLQVVDEIAAVPEVDALFVGPYDLSLSLGILEQFDSPLFLTALEKVIQAGTNAGIAVGLQSKDLSLLKRAREMGARFIIYSSDYSVLLSGYKEGIARLKSWFPAYHPGKDRPLFVPR